jgi:hypothetical protein
MRSEHAAQFDTLLPLRLGTAGQTSDQTRLVDWNGCGEIQWSRSGNLLRANGCAELAQRNNQDDHGKGAAEVRIPVNEFEQSASSAMTISRV